MDLINTKVQRQINITTYVLYPITDVYEKTLKHGVYLAWADL